MPRPILLLVSTLLALSMWPLAPPPAAAGCVAPYLVHEQRRPTLEAGVVERIEGRAFVDGCRDTMTCSAVPGCDSCEYDEPPPEPMQDVELRLAQRGRTWRLGVADAQTASNDHLGWVSWTFELPAGVRPGPAVLRPEGGEPLRVRVR